MSKINGRACVANGRNLYLNSKAIPDYYGVIGDTKVTVEPFDSATNMWHIVAKQGGSGVHGIYSYNYVQDRLPDTSDWSFSFDVKGIGKIAYIGMEKSIRNPVSGTVGSEWSRISQTGHIDNVAGKKAIVMYFYATDSPLDVYIKLPKFELGSTATPLTPAPVDKVFSDGKLVYGRNLIRSSEFNRFWSLPSQAIIVDGYDGHKAVHADTTGWTSGNVDVQQPIYNANVQLIKSGEWYTMSFYAKGTGSIRTYIYPSVVDTSAGSYADGISHGVTVDGFYEWALTDEYVRHSWSFKVKTPLSPTTNEGKMLFRTMAGNSTYASLPKLEQGISATPWTPAPEDVSDYGRNLLTGTGTPWKTQGADGKDGIPNTNSADGKTEYTHFAYANMKYVTGENTNFKLSERATVRFGKDNNWIYKTFDAGTYTASNATFGKDPCQNVVKHAELVSDFSVEQSANKTYVGTYTDYTQADSLDPTAYLWSQIKGDDGANQTSSNKWLFTFGTINQAPFKDGEYVTASFDYTSTGTGAYGTIQPRFNNTPWDKLGGMDAMKDNGHVVRTVQWQSDWTTSGTATGIQIHMDDVATTRTVTVYNMKFERGNKATYWSPAPEDVLK